MPSGGGDHSIVTINKDGESSFPSREFIGKTITIKHQFWDIVNDQGISEKDFVLQTIKDSCDNDVIRLYTYGDSADTNGYGLNAKVSSSLISDDSDTRLNVIDSIIYRMDTPADYDPENFDRYVERNYQEESLQPCGQLETTFEAVRPDGTTGITIGNDGQISFDAGAFPSDRVVEIEIDFRINFSAAPSTFELVNQ